MKNLLSPNPTYAGTDQLQWFSLSKTNAIPFSYQFICPLLVFFLITLASCSEPYEFDTAGEVLVLDGKVSNLPGKTYLRIYQFRNGSTQSLLDRFNVKIVDTRGQEFPVTVADDDSDLYVPVLPGFIGEEGVGYKVIASDNTGITLESSYDTLAPLKNFDFNLGDTTVVVSTESNRPISRKATTAVATLPYDGSPFYAKMDFEYRYMELFTEDTLQVAPIDYTLFACDDIRNCDNEENVIAGLTTVSEWFFIKRSVFCDSLGDIINFVENCDERSLGCCINESQWPVVLQLNMEFMSRESFRFWKDLQRLTDVDGLFFDTYPFPLVGNVECSGCEGDFFGLFWATSETSKVRLEEAFPIL